MLSLGTNLQFIKPKPTPNFDKDVLEPLHKAQAEAARVAAQKATEEAAAAQAAQDAADAAAAAQAAAQPVVYTSGSDLFSRLRICESGGNYATNTGNGFYGAYQYDISTWGGYGGFTLPSDAPASIQDAKAAQTQAQRGWSPWPACSAKLGLSGGGS